ncbi:MAG TPA: 2,3,4,5-tetrahydropyridine-2,6-dicarboxylate N-succinyltransferase [Blastocatellia bacterium]|nr:2,3,4,5-tetrahydropyridine-2,6-dicarboxylate N-succinyltransferase [Blastocatellia bacterium]
MSANLESQIESLFTFRVSELTGDKKREALTVFDEFKRALNRGEVRAASRQPDERWVVHQWVKRGILLGFRLGGLVDYSINDDFRFFDKDTYPLKRLGINDGVRVVPGGSSVRDGAHLGTGVTIMPPAYINVGAYVDDGTMVDSHALVGSCAQVGKRCHISAAAQIGGVLEPVGAMPVIIEDEVLVGGNCGVYEGAIVREGAILASGVILTGGTPVYDAVRGEVYRRSEDGPLEIPAGAVVVAGSRAINVGPAKDWGLSVYTPIIVKYRDEKTEASVKLEDFLR